MYELARLAEEYGSGEMRLTVEQNVIIVDVPDAKVEAMLKEPLLTKFTTTPGNISAGLVACTGSQFCGQAIIETKANAIKVGRGGKWSHALVDNGIRGIKNLCIRKSKCAKSGRLECINLGSCE